MSRWCYLAARKLSNDITLEEMQELEQLLAKDPLLASQLEMHERYFNSGHEQTDIEEEQEDGAWNKVSEIINNRTYKESTAIKTPGFSAKRKFAVGLLLGMPVFMTAIFFFFNNSSMAKIAAQIESSDTKYEVTLPDGSKVTLNKKSRISLCDGFGKTNRKLALEGEAFFQVAHNPKIPFIVSANSVNVKVLGTVFNLRAYTDEKLVQTSLVKGAVEITDVINQHLNIIMKPNEKVTIHRRDEGDKKINSKVNTAYEMQILKAERTTGAIPELAWTEDKLIFTDEPLYEIARRFEKWYNVRILIQDDRLKEEKFTAIFQGEDIDAALAALQITYPFKFRRNQHSDIIIEK